MMIQGRSMNKNSGVDKHLTLYQSWDKTSKKTLPFGTILLTFSENCGASPPSVPMGAKALTLK